MNRSALHITGLSALLLACLLLPACTTITVDSSIHFTAGGEALLRFQPVPPSGTIRISNSGPERAHLEFWGPSPDNPAALDRILTVDLGAGGSTLESISGVQRIEAKMIGPTETTIIYTVQSRDGVGLSVTTGPNAIHREGETPVKPAPGEGVGAPPRSPAGPDTSQPTR